jgi:hypothetical protein
LNEIHGLVRHGWQAESMTEPAEHFRYTAVASRYRKRSWAALHSGTLWQNRLCAANQLVVKLTRFRLSGMKLDDGAAAGWLGLLARQSLVRAIELNSAVA